MRQKSGTWLFSALAGILKVAGVKTDKDEKEIKADMKTDMFVVALETELMSPNCQTVCHKESLGWTSLPKNGDRKT